jgi:hypothetical protein
MYVQTQEIAEQSVAAVAQADGLQPGKQSALLFIEQAIEQQDGGLEFIGRSLEVGGMDGYRNGLSAAPCEQLFAAREGFDGGIEKLAIHLHSRQALLLDQMPERLLHFGVQGIGQFIGIIAVKRLVDEGFYGSQQRAVAGEPDTFMLPQSAIVEVNDFGQGVEAAAMGVAGEIVKLLQFTKDSEIGVRAQNAFQLG